MKIKQRCKILIVESQFIIAADLQLQIVKLGHQVVAICQRPQGVMEVLKKELPDLILMDIGLGGDVNAMEGAKQLSSKTKIPIVYLSYDTDKSTFEKMIDLNPYALIPKPYHKIDLERGINTTLDRIASEKEI